MGLKQSEREFVLHGSSNLTIKKLGGGLLDSEVISRAPLLILRINWILPLPMSGNTINHWHKRFSTNGGSKLKYLLPPWGDDS